MTQDETPRMTRDQKNKEGLKTGSIAMKHEDITERIIGAFYHVYNTLGWGFLEKVYQNALVIELRKRGIAVVANARIEVFYDGELIGDYIADLLIEECVIAELKAAESIAPAHEAQLVNYLKATSIDVGLLLNFGPKPQVRRKIFETARYRPVLPVDPLS